MKTLITVLQYVLIASIVLILGGLTGWYFFLHTKETATKAVDTARGLNSPTPTFGGSTGSTQANQILATGDNTIPITNSGQSISTSPLWRVDQQPVSGMGFVGSASSSLYYIERANGYVLSADSINRTSTRLSNILYPKTYEAQVSTDGSIILRSVNDQGAITTMEGTLGVATSTASSTTQSLRGTYLIPSIRKLVLNTLTKSVFTLTQQGGMTHGVVSDWGNTKLKEVFTSPIASWNPYYLSDGRLFVLESPTDGSDGYVYQIASDTSLVPIVRKTSGLTFLPDPSTSAIVYGSSEGTSLNLYVRESQNGTSTLLTIHTVADKCVWLPGKSKTLYCAVPTETTGGSFIDNWYRGLTHTSDEWWVIDVASGIANKVYSKATLGSVSFDAVRPTMDPTGTYIAFINNTDQSLWMLKITK